LAVQKEVVRQVTSEKAALSVSRDEDTGVVLINDSDGVTPSTLFTAPAIDQAANRKAWVRLTDTNPQVRGFLLGEQEEISWPARDGKTVGNYFQPGFGDIMAGVDVLIAKGIVDGSRMGALGWSAGGHWSNWILTHTDRFKPISSGAGAEKK
jgi:dipeptidyl aminopeptidase/acylaminoacyl peptidase